MSGTLTGGATFSGSVTRDPGENVGIYTIDEGTLSLPSTYTLVFEPAPFKIAPAPLTITANDATRLTGQPNPTFTASYSGFVLGDNPSVVSGLTFTTPATANSPAGNYPIVPDKATTANYAISYVNGKLAVRPIPISTPTPTPAPTSTPGVTWSITPSMTSVNENQGTAIFTISRSSGAQAQTVYVSTVQNEGSTNSGNYVGLDNAAFTFGVGQKTLTVPVTILNKGLVSGSETFSIVVQSTPSASATPSLTATTFTILNNDTVNPPPTPTPSALQDPFREWPDFDPYVGDKHAGCRVDRTDNYKFAERTIFSPLDFVRSSSYS